LSGSGNGQYGVYGDIGSKVLPVGGITPTLTGTSGNIKLYLNQTATWAQINSGTIISDSTYDTLAKTL
jgi:hypothetical protein